MKKTILNRLRSLEEIDHISVTVSGSTKSTVRISHAKVHGVSWLLKWVSGDRFVGYQEFSVPAEATVAGGTVVTSAAAVTIRSGLEATQFVSAYAALDALRARQKK